MVHDHGICVDLACARPSRGTVDDGIVSAMPHYNGLIYMYNKLSSFFQTKSHAVH